MKIIEGCIEDTQFCAEKILHYVQRIGLHPDEVCVFSIGDNRIAIRITVHDEYDRYYCQESVVPNDNINVVLIAGYLRAEMMLADFHTRH